MLDDGTVYTGLQLSAGAVTVSTPFAIWIRQVSPPSGSAGTFTSDRRTGTTAIDARGATLQQQFAVFSNGTGVGALGGLSSDAFGTIINSTGEGAVYYVGMEDIANGGRGFPLDPSGLASDRDYQDIVISIQAVPEPATVMMMLTGLAGLVLVARRRRA